MTLPPPPLEPPICHLVNGLAPEFAAKLPHLLGDLIGQGWRPKLLETLRSDERQRWLYGFGRTWDDGRGVVTNAQNAHQSWHFYGLAVDLTDRRFEPGNEPKAFFDAVGKVARKYALMWGGTWKRPDSPHVQWWIDGMHTSPSPHAMDLMRQGGVEAVWKELKAI